MHTETKRLLIRKFNMEDLQAVYEYTSDANVMKYIPEGVFTEEMAKDFIEQNLGEEAEKFAVILKGENTLIGHIFFGKYFGDHTYEIGWVFNPKFYNKDIHKILKTYGDIYKIDYRDLLINIFEMTINNAVFSILCNSNYPCTRFLRLYGSVKLHR